MRLPARALALPLVALAAAGCGSSSKTAATPAAATTKTTAAAAPKAAAAPATVRIDNFKYLPRTLTVKAGTRITWDNVDKTNHTVTTDKGSALHIGDLPAGAKASATLKAPGTYAYHCDFHPFMHGTITVR